jgi:hypothetical protein
MTDFHDDFTDLLGAYALDAVDAEERERIEAHLHACPWCAAEVAEHREVAAYLSQSGADAPPGVWGRIAAELSPPAPPLRLTLSPVGERDTRTRGVAGAPVRDGEPTDTSSRAEGPVAPVVPLSGRRSFRNRTLVALASAAAVLVAALGFVAVDQAREVDRMKEEIAAPSTIPQGPGDLSVKLTGSDADLGATAVVSGSGRGYLVSHDLPAAGKDELYQLWGVIDGVVLSLGTFDEKAEVVNFQVDPDRIDGVEAFAVTKERAPGVVASENPAVLQGKVT